MEKNKPNIAYLVMLFFILLFSLSLRLYWAYNQNGLYWDEYIGIWLSNNKSSYWHSSDMNSYEGILEYGKEYAGKEIKQKYFYDDSSLEDLLSDLSSLYKYSEDPYISNLYYSLLRLSFAFREVYDVKNVIITGTILNIIFFIISFIFIYKLLKLAFNFDLSDKEHRFILLFSMLCLSIMPSSLSMSLFLRPYQMQETFFIVLTYMVFYIMQYNRYSIVNFIVLTLLVGLGYLVLYSSIVLVLCVSLIIFIYIYLEYIESINCKISAVDKKFNFKLNVPLTLKVMLPIAIFLTLTLIIIAQLGMTKRYGNIEITGSEEYKSEIKKYSAKINYESKIFRRSDIYYLQDAKIEDIESVDFIRNYEIDKMGRVYIFTQKEINQNEIKLLNSKTISYKLKINEDRMANIIFPIIVLPLLIIFIFSNLALIKMSRSVFTKTDTKRLIYFASSFILAFFVSLSLYPSFFRSFFIANDRARSSLNVGKIFYAFENINVYAFNKIFPILIILLFVALYIYNKKYSKMKNEKEINKFPILIIFFGIFTAVFIEIISPGKALRYSLSPYQLIFFIFPFVFIYILKAKKIKYLLMIAVSIIFIGNVFTGKNLVYIESNDMKEEIIFLKDVDKPVYGFNTLISQFSFSYLDNNQKYVLFENINELENKLNTDNPSNFYLVVKLYDNISDLEKMLGDKYILKDSNEYKYLQEVNILEYSKK